MTPMQRSVFAFALVLNGIWLALLVQNLLGDPLGALVGYQHHPWLHWLFLVVVWSTPAVNVAALVWFSRSLVRR
jgi:uncharacterized membrane protein YsdA (DUF1294 family)